MGNEPSNPYKRTDTGTIVRNQPSNVRKPTITGNTAEQVVEKL